MRVILLAVLLACLACNQSAVNSDSRRIDAGWSLEALKNATYSGFQVVVNPVRLNHGTWEGKPHAPGGASRPSIDFVGNYYQIGTIASKDAAAAVVFLSESSGGSGVFLYMAVVEKINDALVNTATTPLGDRVQVRAVRMEKGTLAVDVLQAGPQDAACCPGDLVTRSWRWEAGRLVESASPVMAGRLSLDVIAGVSWKLSTWQIDEPAPGYPEITLAYDNGRITGSAGCNRYFASVTIGESPSDLQVVSSGTTRMMCPETTMAVEQRFLKQLAGVNKFGFLAGQLILSLTIDGQRASMLFNRMVTAP